MKIFKNLLRLATDKQLRFFGLASRTIYRKTSDEEYLKKSYKVVFGKELNLASPKTFSEKMEWLKLNDRKEIYTVMVDKYRMKEFVTSKIGEGHVVPLIGAFDSPDEIDFETLPNQFVLKCNHNQHKGMYICKDKNKLTKKEIKRIKKNLTKGLAQDFYLTHREWPYKNVKRKIIAEQFMKENSRPEADCLVDYKWFCFNGVPKLMYIGTDASSHPTCDWFDMDFNFVDMRNRDPNSLTPPSKPAEFEEMRQFAGKLSQGTKFLRVDFYLIDGEVYVGELTFFPCGGECLFRPEEANLRLGGLIHLD